MNKNFDSHQSQRIENLHGTTLASFPARAGAFVIDFFAASILLMIVGIPVAVLVSRYTHEDIMIRMTFFKNWYSILALVAYFTLATYFGKGQTPGKRLLRIRVISLRHTHLSLWHSFERALGYGASALEFGFGFAQYFIHPNTQTVHDRIAETIVVSEKAPAPKL